MPKIHVPKLRSTTKGYAFVEIDKKRHYLGCHVEDHEAQIEYRKLLARHRLGDFRRDDPGIERRTTLRDLIEAWRIEVERQFIHNGKRMRKRVTDAIRQPTAKDPVYQSVQRLFQVDSEFNLCRLNKELYKNADQIRRLALKRWMLGYPPRKRNDTSIGDAVNWEWIVDCASRVKRDVVIVSRDSDYGVTVDGESFLNDWLLAEFRDRVTMHSQVRLTEKLAKALSWLEVKVTEAERESEEKLLRTTDVGDIRDDWAMPKLEVTESEFREFLRKIARTSKFIYDASSTKSPGDFDSDGNLIR